MSDEPDIKGFKVVWVDGGRWPQVEPNPAFPKGVDIPAVFPDAPTCRTALPYPARRCGQFVVECLRCHLVVLVTTAGRPDDPRSLTLNCASKETMQ